MPQVELFWLLHQLYSLTGSRAHLHNPYYKLPDHTMIASCPTRPPPPSSTRLVLKLTFTFSHSSVYLVPNANALHFPAVPVFPSPIASLAVSTGLASWFGQLSPSSHHMHAHCCCSPCSLLKIVIPKCLWFTHPHSFQVEHPFVKINFVDCPATFPARSPSHHSFLILLFSCQPSSRMLPQWGLACNPFPHL